jgi:hypothetical protein
LVLYSEVLTLSPPVAGNYCIYIYIFHTLFFRVILNPTPSSLHHPLPINNGKISESPPSCPYTPPPPAYNWTHFCYQRERERRIERQRQKSADKNQLVILFLFQNCHQDRTESGSGWEGARGVVGIPSQPDSGLNRTGVWGGREGESSRRRG